MIKIIGYIFMTLPIWGSFIACWKTEGLKAALLAFGFCFLILCIVFVGIYLVENG